MVRPLKQVDASMCTEAVATKMDLLKHLGIVLHGEVKPSAPRLTCRSANRGLSTSQ